MRMLVPKENRRSFLISSTSATLSLPLFAPRILGVTRQALKLSDYPFKLGVASGDPSSDGFVIWTRLAPQPLRGGGMPDENVEVTWRVATDEAMQKVVRRGSAVASPELGHSVHIEVEGLQPDRWYWYQFEAAGETSPRGRSRTFPPAESTPPKLRFAFASCQHYESGLFTAYQHMAQEELDLVVHLGDYIYEGASQDGQVRKHVGPELDSLEDYRNRHAQYKTDPHLQATHAAFPWLLTWDDHEFDNNYAAHISEEDGVSVEAFLDRRARAYQAYYEHMPLRRSSLPQGPDLLLYRQIPFGQLVDFAVLDTRQYRSDQPCGDGTRVPCEGVCDPQATLLGSVQEQWLTKTLSRSQAIWNCLAQQVMMARVDRQVGQQIKWSMDQWAGYEAARKRLLQFLREQQISNPVVLTGDIHTNWVNDLKVDFDDPDSPTVATEFVGTSITSGGDGSPTRSDTAGVLAENPFVRFYNAERGYVSCEVSQKQWQSHYRVVDYVTRPGAPLTTRASFVVEKDRPGAQQAT